MVSRKDVAKEAGVSPTSVSYYINHNGYVSESAAKRIQAAIDKLHYSPNLIAKSLKTRNSRQFIFLCNEIRNPFFTELIASATQAAYQQDYSILFSNIIDDESYLQKLCGYQVSGIFLPNGRVRKKIVDNIIKSGIPIIMLSDISWENISSKITQISTCPEQVYPQIVSHLLDQGYQKMHFLSAAKDFKHTCEDRKVQAFLQASKLDISQSVSYNIATCEDACRYIMETWKPTTVPQAYLCSNDSIAQGVCYALLQKGVSIPQDVGIVGHDNTALSQFNIPSLSTVSLDANALGKQIIEMLIQRVNGETVDDLFVSPRFIARTSTDRITTLQTSSAG